MCSRAPWITLAVTGSMRRPPAVPAREAVSTMETSDRADPPLHLIGDVLEGAVDHAGRDGIDAPAPRRSGARSCINHGTLRSRRAAAPLDRRCARGLRGSRWP